jgi:uncharacterized protein YecE (DUF72 family)
MGRRSSRLHIGTSGWSYSHWKENFYPEKLPTKCWLNFYAGVFPTVEINTTFYHAPLATTTHKWAEDVPGQFQFAIKASRYITHQKRLHDCEGSLKFFYKSIANLQPKAGPVLFQLPPSFRADLERLKTFINLLTSDYRSVFEFRHDSWFTEETYTFLTEHKIGLCITDLNGKESPEEVTAGFTYLRLHGPHKAYQGSYGPARLKALKKKIDRWLEAGTEVYCYFDNDEKGYAIEDARSLLEMFEKKGERHVRK